MANKKEPIGIPTEYAGQVFRSRLEATWARFFDDVGWRWVYEPFDLDGYIPDFVLALKREVLVEVKPVTAIGQYEEHAPKLLGSGWTGEILIVGCGPIAETSHRTVLGLLREVTDPEAGSGWWSEALTMRCASCRRESFYHSEGSYACRVNGCWDGDHHIGEEFGALRLWRQAQNATQWRGGRRP
jgi:hypothetical protein